MGSRGLNVVEGFVADVYLHDSVAIGHPKFDSRQIFVRIFSGIAQGHGLNSNLGRLWLAVFLAAIIVSPKVVEQRIDEGRLIIRTGRAASARRGKHVSRRSVQGGLGGLT